MDCEQSMRPSLYMDLWCYLPMCPLKQCTYLAYEPGYDMTQREVSSCHARTKSSNTLSTCIESRQNICILRVNTTTVDKCISMFRSKINYST